MTRRTRGSGSLFQRADGLWVGRLEIYENRERKRQQVTGLRFCDALRKFSAMHPYRPEFSIPSSPRVEVMREARERGRHTAQEWWTLVRSVKRRCTYCGRQTVHRSPWSLTKDHIVPVTRGGSDAIDNLCVACKQCNSNKGTMTGDEYRAWQHSREVLGFV